MGWIYKFVISERFKNTLWYAISEDDKELEPKPMLNHLNRLGEKGWELIAVIPIGETALMHDQLLKHVLKKASDQRA